MSGHDVCCNPWADRCGLLEELWQERPSARLADVFDDGHALFQAVVEHGLEGIVAKRRSGSTGPATAAGRRSRTRPTGGATLRSSRCSVAESAMWCSGEPKAARSPQVPLGRLVAPSGRG